MNQAMMAKVAEDLVALSKRYGQEKLKIPRDPDQAREFIRKFDYRKEAELSIDDPQVITEADTLARKHRAVLILTNTSELKYEFYVSSDQVRPATSAPSYSGFTPTARQDRGCLIGVGIVVAVIIGAYIIVVINKQSRMSSQQRPAPQQGQLVGTMRAVNANQLNMRSGAGQTYPVVRVFSRNERIVTIGDPQNINGEQWIQASTPDGQTRGWVIRKFLSP